MGELAGFGVHARSLVPRGRCRHRSCRQSRAHPARFRAVGPAVRPMIRAQSSSSPPDLPSEALQYSIADILLTSGVLRYIVTVRECSSENLLSPIGPARGRPIQYAVGHTGQAAKSEAGEENLCTDTRDMSSGKRADPGSGPGPGFRGRSGDRFSWDQPGKERGPWSGSGPCRRLWTRIRSPRRLRSRIRRPDVRPRAQGRTGRRPGRDHRPPGRGADARLPDHHRAHRAQRRGLAAQPGLGLSRPFRSWRTRAW